jgi:hypothetical protein
MTMNSQQGRSVDPEELLLRTDWSSVEHCCPNTAPATPVILLKSTGVHHDILGVARLHNLVQTG